MLRAAEAEPAVGPAGADAGSRQKTLICTSIAGDTVAEALHTIKAANESGADLLELRLDFYKDFEAEQHLKELLSACALPKIVTFRPEWEGCDPWAQQTLVTCGLHTECCTCGHPCPTGCMRSQPAR